MRENNVMDLGKNRRYYGGQGTLEKNILLGCLKSSMAIMLMYLIHEVVSNYTTKLLVSVFFIFFLFTIYGIVYVFILRTNGSHVSRRVAIILFMLAITSGFFVEGGFYGTPLLDLCCVMLTMVTVFSNRERNIFLGLFILQVIFFGYCQIFHSNWIVNIRVNDSSLFYVLRIMVRIANFVYIGYLYKSEFEKERAQVLETSKRLEEINAEVSEQNKIIAKYNIELESMVEERTHHTKELSKKIIEYSFVNSHKIRGPLARVLGLVYLMKLNPVNTEIIYTEYLNKLEASANELDHMVREVTTILNEETKGWI